MKVNLKVDMNSQQVAKFIGSAFKEKSVIREEREYTYSRIDEDTMKDWLTQEKIAEAFDKGLHLSTDAVVPFTKAFDLKDKKLLNDLIVKNLDSLIDEALDYVTPAVRKLFKQGAEHYAMDVLQDEINETITDLFPEEVGESVSTEEVQVIFDNVYSLVEQQSATVDQIAEAILGKDDAFGLQDILQSRADSIGNIAKVNISEQEFNERKGDGSIYVLEYKVVTGLFVDNIKYYKFDVEQGKFVEFPATAEDINAELEKPEAEREIYFLKSRPVTNEDEYSEGTQYYKTFDEDRYNVESIAQSMIDSLESVPGLVTRNDNTWVECSPKQSQVESDIQKAHEAAENPEIEYTQIYYIMVDGEPQPATAWDPDTQYYKREVIVNNVESALALLLDELLNGKANNNSENSSESTEPQAVEGSSFRVVSREASEDEVKSEEDIREVLEKYINKRIPIKSIEDVTTKIGDKAPLILLGVLLVFLLPWALFALVTLIRTLSPRKIWTRTGIIFFWAFPQVILGLVLTYGLKYGIQIAGDKIAIIKTVFEQINLDIRFSCLIPSFIYLGMIPFTIIYLMLAHPFKFQYKFEKRMDLLDKHRAQREARRWRE
jgi:hypothetical protein